jgi:biopolymer transport protein TolQ
VVKSVMIGLALASLWSWTIILDKAFRFRAVNREADLFEEQVGSGRPLTEIARAAGDQPSQALPRMLQGALREWTDATPRRRNGRSDHPEDRPRAGQPDRAREPAD